MATSVSRTPPRKSKKLLIVGDGMCGKTCLLFAFLKKQFLPIHDATIFENYCTHMEVNGETIDLALFDTAGQEEYAGLRRLSYLNTAVVLVCFSIDNPTSAANVMRIWMPEIRNLCGRCPVILVACKQDLRTDPKVIAELAKRHEKPVTTVVGRRLADEIKAKAYMECSAKTGEGVEDVFHRVGQVLVKNRSRLGISCVIN